MTWVAFGIGTFLGMFLGVFLVGICRLMHDETQMPDIKDTWVEPEERK